MTLAASAVTILTPFIKKGAESFADTIGTELGSNVAKATTEKVKNLFNKIKNKFSGDEEAEHALRNFQKKPDRYSSPVQEILKEKFDQDGGFATEVDKLVKQIDLNVIVKIKMEEGEGVIGVEADEMNSGSANVEMEINKGKNITGAKIKKIGPSQNLNETNTNG